MVSIFKLTLPCCLVLSAGRAPLELERFMRNPLLRGGFVVNHWGVVCF